MAETGGGNLQSTAVIAQLFGVSVRRIQQLTQEQVIKTVRDPNGGGRKYDLVPTIQAYIKFLSDKAYGKARSDQESALKEEKLKAEIALKQSQGELHRLKTEIAAGKYISVEEARLDYGHFFVIFKKFALAIPNRVAGHLNGYMEPIAVRAVEKDLATDIKNMLQTFVVAGQVGTGDGGDDGT
jgi:phage terminase Nu1 subunit (DNA packaging protein)